MAGALSAELRELAKNLETKFVAVDVAITELEARPAAPATAAPAATATSQDSCWSGGDL